MRRILPLIICCLVLLPGFMAAQALPRVMSLNLCADPYLMAFADKTQIIALTHLSRDADLSAHAEAAKNHPVSDGQIEAIIALRPDLVIVSSWSDPMRNALIERLGIDLVRLDAAQNFQAAGQEILKLGQAIGRTKEAEAYWRALQEQLAAVQPALNSPRILPLQRRNLTVGDGHILHEVIGLAGGENIGARQGSFMRRVSLETAIAARADFILLGNQSAEADSRGMEFLTHPALAKAYPPAQQIHIPQNLLTCSGATTPDAVRLLVEQITATRTLDAPAR